MKITRNSLKNVIIEQKEVYLSRPCMKRDFKFEEKVNYCFVGIRRAGKSYIVLQQIHNLLENGIKYNQIVYVNFEDERLIEFSTDDLNLILEIALELSGSENEPYIFLDEIQNIPGWEKFVRRLADMKYHVSITGSNSKMLSNEIATTLGGRFMIQYVFPYSFREYLSARGLPSFSDDFSDVDSFTTKKRAQIFQEYSTYVKYGAFPELVEISSKRDFLNSVYQTIYLGDVITRNKITNDFAIRLILKKVAESVMTPLSFTRLTNILKSSGEAIGKSTVIKYVGFIKDSFMLFTVQNYASKLVDKETSPKYYFIDTGILGLFLLGGETSQLENLVAVNLLRRFGEKNIFFYSKNEEIDFYVPEENLAIQVCFDLYFDDATFERETSALVKFSKYKSETKCLIITNDTEKTLEIDGTKIDVIPAWKWILANL